MKRVSSILLLLMIYTSAIAQSIAEKEMDYSFYENRVSKTHRMNVKVDGEENLEAYLENIFGVDLLHSYVFENSTGIHYTYEHVYNGIVVYNSQLKAHVNKQGYLFMAQENLISTTDWGDFKNLDVSIPDKISKQFNVSITAQKQVVYVSNNIPTVAWEIKTHSNITYRSYEYLIDKNLSVLYARDLKRYSAPPPPDSTIKAAVFLPDPLTKAEANYGTPYLDLGDSNLQELNNELDTVEFRVKYELNTFYLENDYFSIGNVSPPTNTTVISGTPEFYFGRGDTEFEYVNCFYHLNVYKDYLIDIGCSALLNEIVFDPHAHNGGDQSSFDGNNTPWTLEYGDGGVDDGEDADVIIHEYAHSFVEKTSPNTFVGNERRSLEEGLCDYLAVSYSRTFSEFDWHKVFNWDGHNEYWDGRTAKTDKIYPDQLTGNDIHTNGEMFSTALMETWEIIGREKTDKILLESLPYLTQDQTMTQFAEAIIMVDSMVNNAENRTALLLGFIHRGIIKDWRVGIDPLEDKPELIVTGTQEFSQGIASAQIKLLNDEILDYKVIDISGREVINQNILNSHEIILNPSEFKQGVYFVVITTAKETYRIKLVKG